MELNKEKRLIIWLASVLSILQATAWWLMAVTAIGVYFKQPEMKVDETTSYSRMVSILLYGRYLYNPDETISVSFYKDMIIKVSQFQTLMWIYFTSDLLWLIYSIRLLPLSRISSQLPTEVARKRIIAWIGGVITISLIDFVLFCILASDYNRCPFSAVNFSDMGNGFLCHLTGGILMTVVAKGYLLWFLNIGFVILIIGILKEHYMARNNVNNI